MEIFQLLLYYIYVNFVYGIQTRVYLFILSAVLALLNKIYVCKIVNKII